MTPPVLDSQPWTLSCTYTQWLVRHILTGQSNRECEASINHESRILYE